MSRPLAEALYRAAFVPPLRTACDAPGHVHVVGVGSELIGLAAASYARSANAPLTVWPATHPGSWGDGPLDRSLLTKAAAVFVASSSEAEALRELGVDPARFVHSALGPAVPPGGDGAAFRERYGLGASPVVLFVGRKQRYKGYHATCSAVAILAHRIPDLTLVAIGTDFEPPYPDHAPARLLDLGRVDDREKADAIAACDVFCMPSIAESFGMAFVEAWSYRKPVIAAIGSGSEIPDHERNALLVVPRPSEIAAALSRLLTNSEEARRLGEAGYKQQQELWNWERCVRDHELTFAQVGSERA